MRLVLKIIAAPTFCMYCSSAAVSATYYKCIDGKGAVTMQETPCKLNATQEVNKVWAQPPTAVDRARAMDETQRLKDAVTAKQRQAAEEAAALNKAAEMVAAAKVEAKRKRNLDECLDRKIVAVEAYQRVLRYQQSLPLDKKATRYVIPTPVNCAEFLK